MEKDVEVNTTVELGDEQIARGGKLILQDAEGGQAYMTPCRGGRCRPSFVADMAPRISESTGIMMAPMTQLGGCFDED